MQYASSSTACSKIVLSIFSICSLAVSITASDAVIESRTLGSSIQSDSSSSVTFFQALLDSRRAVVRSKTLRRPSRLAVLCRTSWERLRSKSRTARFFFG